MPRGDDAQLNAAKRSYKDSVAEGNRQEEARWANVIGDILKNRGEYVEALKWLRIDYEVSVKYLPEKQLLPTCQSLGEVYLRLEFFKDALIYQVTSFVSFNRFFIILLLDCRRPQVKRKKTEVLKHEYFVFLLKELEELKSTKTCAM
ncbi:hypothetical protein NMG60_11007108 [Bertholletia excelsa]